MAKRETVTYERVAEECMAMIRAGTKITVAQLRQRLGGSNTTLIAHLNAWKDSQAAELRGRRELPGELLNALSSAIARLEDAAQAAIKERLLSTQNDLTELAQANGELEERVAEQDEQIKQLSADCEMLKGRNDSQVGELEAARGIAQAERLRAETARVEAATSAMKTAAAEALVVEVRASCAEQLAQSNSREKAARESAEGLRAEVELQGRGLVEARAALAEANRQAAVLQAQLEAERRAKEVALERADECSRQVASLEGAVAREAAAVAKAEELKATNDLLRSLVPKQA